MPIRAPELLKGTLDLMILKTLALEPLHGYGVLVRLQQMSGQRLEIQQGSLYPALYRLEERGWVRGSWGESENHRKAKFYSLTAVGRRRLAGEERRWRQMTGIMAGILGARREES